MKFVNYFFIYERNGDFAMYKERLEELITLLKISKTDFANSIGYSSGNISDWLNGRSNPSKKAVDEICNVFNVSRNWLTTGNGDTFLSNSVHPTNRINELISLLNIKKSEFADKINVSAGNVSNWINGISNPSKKAIDSICTTFSVSKEWLLYGIGNPFIVENHFVNETNYSLSVDEEAIIDNYRLLGRKRQKELYFITTEMVIEEKKEQEINKSKLSSSQTIEDDNLNIG